jgi:PAS domain-containing protein
MTGLPKNEVELGTLAGRADEEVADHLAAIVDCSDDAMLSKDLHGRITSWNKGAERLSATPPQRRSASRSRC